MNRKECQEYFDILTNNPEQLSVFYSFRDSVNTNNNVSGFSMLSKATDGITYYDRIYGYDIEDAILIEMELIKRGYKYLSPDADKKEIKLDKWDFKLYPYMDRFVFLNIKNGILSNKTDEANKNDIVLLDCTDGTYYTEDYDNFIDDEALDYGS